MNLRISEKEIEDRINRVAAEAINLPVRKQIPFLAAEVAKQFPDGMDGAAFALVNKRMVEMASNIGENVARDKDWPTKWAVAIGVGFVLIAFTTCLFIPEPSWFQYLIIRSMFALGGAAFSSIIPGLLRIELKNYLVAAGALGVLVLLFKFNPAPLLVTPPG